MSCESRRAQAIPAGPPPTMTTSASIWGRSMPTRGFRKISIQRWATNSFLHGFARGCESTNSLLQMARRGITQILTRFLQRVALGDRTRQLFRGSNVAFPFRLRDFLENRGKSHVHEKILRGCIRSPASIRGSARRRLRHLAIAESVRDVTGCSLSIHHNQRPALARYLGIYPCSSA